MSIKDILNKDLDSISLSKRSIIGVKICLYALLSAFLIYISFNAWPDILVDFGHELYIPWRISEGDVLYRDIFFSELGGPVSLYWNAFWFSVFGAHIYVIVAVNLVLLILLIFLIENWLKTISDNFTGTVMVLFFLSVFAFSRFTLIGNYNYLTPYSASLVHGIIIIFGIMSALRRWSLSKSNWWLALAGLLFGLTLLNKIEIIVATTATVITYFAAHYFIAKNRPPILKTLVIFSSAVIFVPAITVFLFSAAMPLKDAAYNIFNQLVMLFDGRLGQMSDVLFYRQMRGTDNIMESISLLLAVSSVYLLIFIGAIITASFSKSKNFSLLRFLLITVCASLSLYLLVKYRVFWLSTYPLPIIMLAGFVIWLFILKKTRHSLSESSNLPLILASFAFAGTMLLKIALGGRLYHYGFALSMPSAILLGVILLYWIPKHFKNSYGEWGLRAFFLGVFIAASIGLIGLSSENYNRNTYICCQASGEKIRTDELRGPIIDNTLTFLKNIARPGQTFTVIPEGSMFNFMLKVRNPTPFFVFIPTNFITSGEEKILNSVIKNQPDFFVMVHSDTSIFSFRSFGKDYGTRLYEWIMKNYRLVWQDGGYPFQEGTDFGIVIMAKNNN